MSWILFWTVSPQQEPQFSPEASSLLFRVKSRGSVLTEDENLARIRTWTWVALAAEANRLAYHARTRLWVEPYYRLLLFPELPQEVGANRLVVWGGWPSSGWRLEFEEWV